MSATEVRVTSEEESRKVAEESREQEWVGRAFVREMFLGNFKLDVIHPFPIETTERPEFVKFYTDLEKFLKEKVDPVAIDETGEYPEQVVDGLRQLLGERQRDRTGGSGAGNRAGALRRNTVRAQPLRQERPLLG